MERLARGFPRCTLVVSLQFALSPPLDHFPKIRTHRVRLCRCQFTRVYTGRLVPESKADPGDDTGASIPLIISLMYRMKQRWSSPHTAGTGSPDVQSAPPQRLPLVGSVVRCVDAGTWVALALSHFARWATPELRSCRLAYLLLPLGFLSGCASTHDARSDRAHASWNPTRQRSAGDPVPLSRDRRNHPCRPRLILVSPGA
jgi:hypothetical protein